MKLWDIHTLPSAGLPVRHFQPYPDQATALRMAAHLVGVLDVLLVVEPVDDAAWLDRLLGREVVR